MRLDKNTVFDYKTHRKNFINYLEVIILKDGKIVYAVPSHQMKLIDIYIKENNINREDLLDTIPIEEDIICWLIYHTECVAVWYNFVYAPDNITDKQKESLRRLSNEKCIDHGYILYSIYLEESTGYLRNRQGEKL